MPTPGNIQAFFDDPQATAEDIANRFGLAPNGSINLGTLRKAMQGGLPKTQTRLSHSLTIRSGTTGRVVGAIKSWATQQTREVQDHFEVNPYAVGMPIDVVPQKVTSRSLRISRYDLYIRLFEEAFGTTELVVLTDQFRPLTIREVWRSPMGIFNSGIRAYDFVGCWFEDIGRTLDAAGDRAVLAEATLRWTNRIQLL